MDKVVMTENNKKCTCRNKRKTQEKPSLTVRDLKSNLDHFISVVKEWEIQAFINCTYENGQPKYFASLKNRLRLA